VFVLKSFFLTHLLGEQLRPSPYTFLSRQSHFPPSESKNLEQRKEMTFDRTLTSIIDPVLVFRVLYCPFSENLIKKVLHKIMANIQG